MNFTWMEQFLIQFMKWTRMHCNWNTHQRKFINSKNWRILFFQLCCFFFLAHILLQNGIIVQNTINQDLCGQYTCAMFGDRPHQKNGQKFKMLTQSIPNILIFYFLKYNHSYLHVCMNKIDCDKLNGLMEYDIRHTSIHEMGEFVSIYDKKILIKVLLSNNCW